MRVKCGRLGNKGWLPSGSGGKGLWSCLREGEASADGSPWHPAGPEPRVIPYCVDYLKKMIFTCEILAFFVTEWL